jgi:hypothetical protein
MAEFAINNSYHESTGSTPFRLNTGMDPRMPTTASTHGTRVPAAGEFVHVMETELRDAKLRLQQAQQRMKAYYDTGRKDLVLVVGQKVLLNTKNLKLKKLGDKTFTRKLVPKWIGPFVITHDVGKNAYVWL